MKNNKKCNTPKSKITWLKQPEDTNYPAAISYLTLLFPLIEAEVIGIKLKDGLRTSFKAKDIFRASGLSLLGISNKHVKKDQEKIEANKKLSPLLLVRHNNKLIIADGYHRLCAVYSYDEDAWIPCHIVEV